MKFCCQTFKRDWNLDHRVKFNIRIVKIDDKLVPDINKSKPYRFFITKGYEKGDINVSNRMIFYCPYCGCDLNQMYKSDEFINEVDHSFISF